MECVAPFQAPGRFIKLIALLKLPARGHVFNAMPVNQHRMGGVPLRWDWEPGVAAKRLSLSPAAHGPSRGHRTDTEGTITNRTLIGCQSRYHVCGEPTMCQGPLCLALLVKH